MMGIHTPETDQEKDLDKVKKKIKDLGITYPVVLDAKTDCWNSFGTAWWPSVFVIDKKGFVRQWWYGELNWKETKGEEMFRKKIEELLAE
jgi:peroxiredoxin